MEQLLYLDKHSDGDLTSWLDHELISVLLQLGFNHQELRSYTLQRYLMESKVRDCVRICTESAKLFSLMDCKIGLNKIVWLSHTCARSIWNNLCEEQCCEIFENKTNKLSHESNKSQGIKQMKSQADPQEIFVICWSADCQGKSRLDTLFFKGFLGLGL